LTIYVETRSQVFFASIRFPIDYGSGEARKGNFDAPAQEPARLHADFTSARSAAAVKLLLWNLD
jgi:hypothetical protein